MWNKALQSDEYFKNAWETCFKIRFLSHYWKNFNKKVSVIKEIKFGESNEHDENEYPAVRVNIKIDEESEGTNKENGDTPFQIKTSSSQKSVKLAFEDILRLNLSTNERVYLARHLYFHPHSLSFSSINEG